RSALFQPISAIDLSYSGLVNLVRASLRDYQLVEENETDLPEGRRFIVANARGKANISVYKSGRVYPQGASGPALDAAMQLVKERVPAEPEKRKPLTFQLPVGLRDRYS